MNWVGGSRNRLVMKNDAKKQKEFFAKKKLQQKLQKLGVAPPASSAGDISNGGTDLLTLFVVNQIASTKTNQEPPKVATFGRSKGSRHKIVLPMSPCSPSRLNFVEGAAQSSVKEIREQMSPQRFKNRQLSPVLESVFSENCASDYLPSINDPPPSISPSGHGFFLQKQAQTQPLPHYSPPQWDTSTLPQAEFQPFSQPRSMTDPISWSVRSNPPPFQLGTPTSQFLFGSPKPDKTEAGSYGEHSGPFILNQREPEQPTLEFPRSHSEPLHLFEEEDFPIFNEDKHGRESAPFGDAGMQYLREESSVRPPSPQTVPNPQASGMELFHCSDTHSSCLGENAGLLESFEYSPSCSCRGGYPSSDSNDDEPYCESCPQEPAFYSDEACCSDGRKSASQRITVLSQQQQPLTPLMRSKTNVRGTPNMTLNEAITDTASGGQQTGTFNAPFSSPRPIAETQSSEICRCKKMCSESQDVGTQTAYTSAADTQDASTQCSFVENTKTRASGFPLLRPAVDASQQFPAHERESEVEPQTLRASSKGPGSKDGVALLSWKKPKNASGGMAFNNVTAEKRLIKPVIGIWSLKGEENGGMRERTGPDENNPLVREVFDRGRQEVTSASRGHTLSEEEETLREIADVLLLMKQRRNDQE